MNGISAFTKGAPEHSPAPRTQQEDTISDPGSDPHQTQNLRQHDLGLPISRTVRNKFVFYKLLSA